MWHLQKFLYRNVFGFWFLLHIAMLRRKFSWRRLLLANLVDRRNLASRCASLVSTNWKALWMLSCCSPSNQYYLYLWAFLDSCDVWALTGSSAKPFLVDEIELPRDSIFRTLWEPPHDIPSLESKRKMRLLRRWAVAKTLKMCWPKPNVPTHTSAPLLWTNNWEDVRTENSWLIDWLCHTRIQQSAGLLCRTENSWLWGVERHEVSFISVGTLVGRCHLLTLIFNRVRFKARTTGDF